MSQDLVFRLEERARIRRQIATRRSVQEGKPDRIADLLEEAACTIKVLEGARPHWAQGWTGDGIAAQCSSAALTQLWELLGVKHQTDAAMSLRRLCEDAAKIVAHLWADVPKAERPADLIADLIERHDHWQDKAEGLAAFKRSVDEALNSGDGSYRP